LVCHGELAKDHPETQYLTEYYLWISFGGLLGGLFNGFLAPLIFSTVAEYPLAMIVAALLRPRLETKAAQRGGHYADALWPAALLCLLFAIKWWTRDHHVFSAYVTHLLIFGVAALIGLSFARRPIRFALGIAAVMVATHSYTGAFGDVLFQERSFFGVYRAMQGEQI
jgi:hypothetical protein